MSTYDESLLAARFAALAPRPLPGDWGHVLDRAGAVPPRRRRLARSLWRGGRRRKLVVALAVAALVAAVAAAAYGTVRVLFLDRGFIGLPPVGATPSTPESGELVLQWLGRSATHAHARERYDGPLVRTWVYADGRMIWSREGRPVARPIPEGANEFTSGYLEQRLTPEGIELLRSAVAGLFDRSRALLQTVPADDPQLGRLFGRLLNVPRDHRSSWGSVDVPSGDQLIRLSWGDPSWGEHTTATPEQLSDLRRVDALLTDPASVLPPSAWDVREVRAYVPSHYAVCIDASPPKDASELLVLLPARAADVLRDESRTRRDGERAGGDSEGSVVRSRSVEYCSKLTTEEAREVAEALSGLDPEQPRRLEYRLAEGAHGLETTTIYFEPYFPHGQVTCSSCA